MSKILIIDDDRDFARSLQIQLEMAGHSVVTATTGAAGIERYRELDPDVVVLDLKLRETDGLSIIRELRDLDLQAPVVMITGEQDARANIEAVKLGVAEYLRKPFAVERLLEVVAQVLETDESELPADVMPVQRISENRYEIVGRNPKIMELLKQIGLLSRSTVTVLIRGESGTGKEIVGRALHEAATPDQPFIGINCTAVVANLLESELFGHEKGAFTGAERRKIGVFEQAAMGTLFLDEIGDLPIELQPKVLRVIQEREFTLVGGTEPIQFEARLIAATHRNLEEMVEKGEFREDLYYRLAVTALDLPTLRERKDDLELLMQHLLYGISRDLHRPISGITTEAVDQLRAYHWPGNVREMANVLTRAVALSQRDVLTAQDLHLGSGDALPSPWLSDGEILSLAEVEKRYLKMALDATKWNITQTAEKLGITRNTLKKKIGDYGLDRSPA